jgi:hypothetical protein
MATSLVCTYNQTRPSVVLLQEAFFKHLDADIVCMQVRGSSSSSGGGGCSGVSGSNSVQQGCYLHASLPHRHLPGSTRASNKRTMWCTTATTLLHDIATVLHCYLNCRR